MYRFTINGVSVVATLDIRRMKNDGTYPIKIQVVHCSKQVYYNTYLSLTKEDWLKISTSKNKFIAEIRQIVEKYFSKIKEAVTEIVNNDKFSFALLSSYLGKYSSKTVNEAFKVKINDLYNNQQINSYYNYRSALKAIEKFGGNDILFSEVTPTWLKRCEEFWLSQGLSYSSMSFYLRDLKSIINTAIRDGVVSSKVYPFGVGKYEIPNGVARKMALNLSDIKKIVDCSLENSEMEMYRDLWFFSYLCNGINFKDMIFLKKSDIINGEICFVRDKTAKSTRHSRLIQAPVVPAMKNIIKRWGMQDSEFLFPFAKGDETEEEKVKIVRRVVMKCNKVLRVIGDTLNIKGRITTYCARHSFATVLKRSGVNISYISESLGHSSVKVTETYLDSFNFDERRKNSKLLTKF